MVTVTALVGSTRDATLWLSKWKPPQAGHVRAPVATPPAGDKTGAQHGSPERLKIFPTTSGSVRIASTIIVMVWRVVEQLGEASASRRRTRMPDAGIDLTCIRKVRERPPARNFRRVPRRPYGSGGSARGNGKSRVPFHPWPKSA
jgi:hypothetical protein